jgi:hypothetical protein
MKLTLVGVRGRRELDWTSYALLRDNVQHFIEDGRPSARFAALHAIEAAVDTGALHSVDAARIRGEVLQARCRLAKVRLADAAVSIRTRAIVTGCPGQPASRGTALARHTGWKLSVRADPQALLLSLVADFVDAVLDLTERSVDGEILTVHRNRGALRSTWANRQKAAS